jgi:hypothetical protein
MYMNQDLDWDAVGKAYDLVAEGIANRIDGDGYKVYRVAQVVRIDIDDKDK